MIYITIPLSALFFCIFLAIYILWKDGKNIANKFFALQIFSASFWVFSNFMADIAKTAEINLFWSRTTLIGASLVVLFFYLFSLHFPKEKSSNPIYKYVVLFFSLLIIILSPTEWNIVSVYPINGGFGINTGFLYLLFLFYFSLTIVFSVFNLFHRADTNIEKTQVKFIIVGLMVTMISAFLTNAILPVLGNSQYISVGSYFIVFFLISTFYAMLKHQLFGVKVIRTELFTFAIWLVLLVKVFFSNDINDLFINISLLLTVVFFGAMMIRAVIREVQQKEQIEKMAKEVARAYELEKRAKEQTEKAYELEKKANEELKAVDEAKSQFMAITQHHLRTPLTSMMGYLDLLLANNYGKISVKVKDILKRLEVSTQNEIKIVNDLLNVSEFQMGKGAIQANPEVNIKEILEDVVKDLVLESEKKGLYLKIEKQNDLLIPLIMADRNKLKMAITNIVDNAVKYTQKGGILIKVKSKDKKLTVEIADTGIGMTKQESQTLFGKTFQRGEEAKKLFVTGKGIGLFLSAKIIEAHKGKIWAESEGQGKGSTFFIELPANN